MYEVKRDADGNIVAIRISPDGEVPERWIRVTNESGLFVASNNNGQFVIEDGTLNVYDENGNLIGQVGPSKYTVYDVMYNEDGSIRAIRISEDGVVPEQWIRVGEGNAIAHMEFVGQVGKYEFTGDYIDILDKDGIYHFIECNPRFSAGCEFACMNGYDCVENHIKCFMGQEIEDYHFKHNMIIARKYEEYITATNIDVPYGKTWN